MQLTGSDCDVVTANIFCEALRGERFWWNDVDDVIKKIHDDKKEFHKCCDVGYSWIALCLNELFYWKWRITYVELAMTFCNLEEYSKALICFSTSLSEALFSQVSCHWTPYFSLVDFYFYLNVYCHIVTPPPFPKDSVLFTLEVNNFVSGNFDPFKPCLHVTFFTPMNDGQNWSVTQSFYHSDCHHWHNAKP